MSQSVHYDNATTNVVDYQPGLRMRLKGKLLQIKSQKEMPGGKKSNLLIEFILQVPSRNQQNPHHYHIKAFSDTGHDRFNLTARLGEEVECYCYLNGRAVMTDKGTWHTNELSLHSMN